MGNLLTWQLSSWQRWQSLAAECCVDALINRRSIESWLEVESVVSKGQTSSLNDHNRERIARKSNFRNLEKLQKEWTESGVNASSGKELQFILNQRRCQKHLTWDKEKRVGLWFNGPKSSLQMKVIFILFPCFMSRTPDIPQTYSLGKVQRDRI